MGKVAVISMIVYAMPGAVMAQHEHHHEPAQGDDQEQTTEKEHDHAQHAHVMEMTSDDSARLSVIPGDPETKHDVFQGQFGYLHRFTGGPVVPFIGASVDVGLVPASLEAEYGTRIPVGAFVFVGVQPAKLAAAHEHR
jgi:hypothetical protein